MHVVQPEIKIHTVVTGEMDFDHNAAMKIPLGECNDEQLMAEVARRNLDVHDKITDQLVKEAYDLGKVLGHGASGEVLECTHRITQKKYACKVVKKSTMNDAQSMSTEIEIMKRIRHKHVVSMYELYETPKCLWIILELVSGGDLFHHLAETPDYCEYDASRHMRQMLSGVHYLHSLGVVHRDLKLDNILLKDKGKNGEVKLADFGLSALIRLGEQGYDPDESAKRKSYNELRDMWGTKEYFAPEVTDQGYGPQADVWALGCILYELLTGHQAFPKLKSDRDDRALYDRIRKGDYSLSIHGLDQVSREARDLISKMLQVKPQNRLSASEALNHPWIVSPQTLPEAERPLVKSHESIKHKLEARLIREEEQKAKRHA
jgi:calcium/calmodulin-dependent protein kinase I